MRKIRRSVDRRQQVLVLEPRLLLAAPANDNWQDAILLDPVSNVIVGSTVGATTDAGPWGWSYDVWYRYDSTVAGQIELSVTGGLSLGVAATPTSRTWLKNGNLEYAVAADTTYYLQIGGSSAGSPYEIRVNRVNGGDVTMPRATPISDSAVSADSITVSWIDSAEATGYTLSRRYFPDIPAGTREPVLISLPAGTSSYTDVTAAPGDRYSYQLLTETNSGTTVWCAQSDLGILPPNDHWTTAQAIDPAGGGSHRLGDDGKQRAAGVGQRSGQQTGLGLVHVDTS